MSMQLRAYRYFHEVAKCNSVREAAKRLHVAPTAISKQIEHLEHEFKTQLLERGPRGVSLTAEGAFLAERIAVILNQLSQVNSFLAERRGIVAGTLSIHASEGLVPGLLSPVVREFVRAYPDVNITIAVGTAEQTLNSLVTGTADVGLAFYVPDRPGVERLCSVHINHCAVFHESHPLAKLETLDILLLAKEPVAVPSSEFNTRSTIERSMQRHGIEFKPKWITSSLETQISLAFNGVAVLILPATAIDESFARLGLKAVPIADEVLGTVRVDVCRYKHKSSTKLVETFCDFLTRSVQSLPIGIGSGQ